MFTQNTALFCCFCYRITYSILLVFKVSPIVIMFCMVLSVVYGPSCVVAAALIILICMRFFSLLLHVCQFVSRLHIFLLCFRHCNGKSLDNMRFFFSVYVTKWTFEHSKRLKVFFPTHDYIEYAYALCTSHIRHKMIENDDIKKLFIIKVSKKIKIWFIFHEIMKSKQKEMFQTAKMTKTTLDRIEVMIVWCESQK